MPLMRYFMYVGGALLALLLIANICLPTPPVPQKSQSATDLSVVRIHSDQKWPERVVFDTTRPTITPAPAPAAVVAEAPQPPQPKTTAADPAKGHMREAYAQMRPNPGDPRSAEPKRKRRTVAKNYNYNYYGQQRIVVAQQPPVLFFGGNIW